MPERIFVLFADVPHERERVRLMFRDAGMFDQYVKLAKPADPSPLVHKIELPNEETAQRITAAAALHGLKGLSFQRGMDPTPKELAAAPLLYLRAGGPVVVEATMPPMLASSRGLIRGRAGAERPCARCGRDGWFDTTQDPFMPSYPRSVLDTMPDAAWTDELFSTGAWATPLNGKRSLASRRLIVRPRVYAAWKPLKLRGVRWFPVRVE